MEPTLFVLALVFYGEGSTDVVTRTISRAILYTYLMVMVISTYGTNLEISLIVCMLCTTVSYIFCYTKVPFKTAKILICVLAVFMIIAYLSIIAGKIPSNSILQTLLSYSNYIYRDGSLALISTVSMLHGIKNKTHEEKLNMTVCGMWLMEKSFFLM